jgi:DNA-binding CsgD family transcriptional regulator/tetratricopeptide (TPR) repeat protein
MGRSAGRSRPTGAPRLVDPERGRPGQRAGLDDVLSSPEYGRGVLVGRDPERAQLESLVELARHGSAGSVVVRGEPGIGKSALLDAVVADVGDATVLTTQGLEAEAPLAFAALHRLLRPVLRLRDGLPAPQARALGVAFGEEDGPGVEPFLVAVATLSMLTAAAEEKLVVCLVDDAHWLDSASTDALLFCARRLGADRVVMVFAAREDTDETFDPQGLPEMVLSGLDRESARALLSAHQGGAPAEEVAERLVVETRGNPLALMELPGELSLAQLQGFVALPTQLHLTAHVERSFLDRCRRLPSRVQLLLLLAAADDTGGRAVVRRASAGLGVGEPALEAALESGLLSVDGGSVRVRHPLLRSAVYQAATAADRRLVHQALADALAGAGDPDRETWHRAFAVEGPDEDVVAALELVGSRALRRGGYVAAAAAYERAAALTGDAARRADLTFAAARSAWACGQGAHARALLTAAREGATDPLLVCDIARLRGHIEVNIGSATEAHRIFVDAAHEVHEVDPVRALEIATAAAVMRTFGADSGTRLPSGDVVAIPSAADAPRTRCLKQLLTSMTSAAEGQWAGAVAALDQALLTGEDVDDRDLLWNLGNAALQLGDDDAQLRFYSYALSRAREAGAVTAVVYVLQRLCFGHFVGGDLVLLRSCAEEARSLAVSAGQPALAALPIAWLAMLAAVQDGEDFDGLLGDLDDVMAAHSLGIATDPVHDLGRWARGMRASATGDAAGALHHLGRIRLRFVARTAAADRIDTAVRAGEPGLVQGWTEELVGYAEGTRRPWALATVAYGRAMTSEVGDAEGSFNEALSQFARAHRPLDEARVQLSYGEWLRRGQRRIDARRHLRRALETFEDLRVPALAERANQELRASGETARKRDPSTLVALTPTELKIAQLVSAGMSNKDVAAQCWISPRTVAFHLRNVFTKAGITSRGELAQLDLT